MNGIDRRGQKVVCISQLEIEDANGKKAGIQLPVVDETYTVEDFLDSGMVIDGAPLDGPSSPGITLCEIPTIRGRLKMGGEIVYLGWPIICFRPVDERKTDISELIALGKLENISEPA